MDAAQLREQALRAAEDPSIIDNMSEEEISALRRAVNPAGGVASTKGSYANMSVLNFTDESRKKFLMMSLIGYVYRLAAEWEPDTEQYMEAWRTRVESVRGDERKAAIAARDLEIKTHHANERKTVLKFLDRNFEFNPDIHVRNAKSSGFSDPERVRMQHRVREALEADRLAAAQAALSKEDSYGKLKTVTLRAYREISLATEAVMKCVRVANAIPDSEDEKIILLKHAQSLISLHANLGKVARPIAAAETAEALRVEPPADLFHNFERYMSNHYEALNDLQVAYFNEKPDIEFMVILHSIHREEKDAREYCKQHYRDFRAPVVTISSGGATILGPYKGNRDRVDYYNQQTEVLRAMAEQVEADAKLGKDMLDKSVQRKKATNIREDGPDRIGLTGYRTSGIMSASGGEHVSDMGAKKVVTPEKMRELEAAAAAEAAARPPIVVAAPSLASSAASALTSAASAPPMSEDDLPRMTELAKKTHIFNVESAYHERPPVDAFDAARISGKYSVNDTTPDDELPEDAVHMDMFIPVVGDDGETRLVKRAAYTAAEAPLHLERDSPFAGKYQPARQAGVDILDSITEKEVVTASGQKTIVHVPRAADDI